MDLAIVHYHLNRGGVTQVILNHLRALAQTSSVGRPRRVVIFYGGRRTAWPDHLADELDTLPVELHAIAELDYDDDQSPQPDRLAQLLEAAFSQCRFDPAATLVHVHNHSLGKNVSLPGALIELARKGYRLLLQIHDFAEDLRPRMYARLRETLAAEHPEQLSATLYPQAAQIHYAVLNRRDADALLRAGIVSERVHWLPNPVFAPEGLPTRDAARAKLAEQAGIAVDVPLLVYPVRGIARKNIGEMLLWSAVAQDRAWFAMTQPPLNPQEKPLYERWKQLAADLQLACTFEIGTLPGVRFADSLAAADRFLTTSLAEGFGMVFLETWLAGRPLVGRDLPDITADFVHSGLHFPGLQEKLLVPIDWVGHEAFVTMLAGTYRRALESYGRPVPAEMALREACAALVEDEQVDFGTLDADLQEQVIRHVQASPTARKQLLIENPWLAQASTFPDEQEQRLVAQNAEAVHAHYSLNVCGTRLAEAYAQLAEAQPVPEFDAPISADEMLTSFLDLQRFRPLRT